MGVRSGDRGADRNMKRLAPHRAFTIAELIISMAASMLIVGALLAGSMGLQRSLHASEIYGTSQSDQRRLIDYVARDLRRAVAFAATDEGGASGMGAGGTASIADRATLVLTLPGYYKSDVPADADFDQPLPVIASNEGVAYGTTAGPAPGVVVRYRKVFVAEEGCVCFVRQEAETKRIIVRRADDLSLRVTIADDGMSGVIEASFRTPSSGVRPLVSTCDQVMLRNRRADRAE